MFKRSTHQALALWKRVARRITAVGFIILVLGGNFWVIVRLMGESVPTLLTWAGGLGLFTVTLGGFGQIVLLVWETMSLKIGSNRRE